jgi:uncharacterized repeat protein (TIGR03943 family)
MTQGRMNAGVLFVWAGFLIWLLLSGQVYRYIGPRTYWVVIFGAICLSFAAILYAIAGHTDRTRITSRQALGALALVVPIFLVFVVPEPSLGSLAASRKITGGVAVTGALRPESFQSGVEIGFREISYASQSAAHAASIGIIEGYEVELTGFVSDKTVPTGTFPLTRFSIFCCAADVVPHTVPVKASGENIAYAPDTWLKVEGKLVKFGETYVIEPTSVELVQEPRNPYIQ